MARVSILCVVRDGAVPTDGTLARILEEQSVTWPVGDAGTIELAVVGEDGAVVDLTGKTLTVTCRRHCGDFFPVFSVNAVNDETPQGGDPPGTAVATLTSSNTSRMTTGLEYWYDVRMVDANSSQQVAPASKWFPGPIVTRVNGSSA